MIWIDLKSLSALDRGDEIRHKITGSRYTVISNFGDHATAVRIADVTNSMEWEVLKPERKVAK